MNLEHDRYRRKNMIRAPGSVCIVEVGAYGGVQSLPMESRITMIDALHAAGVGRMEIAAFTDATTAVQSAQAASILAAVDRLRGLDTQVLALTARQAERALAAGATHLSTVISVTERHSRREARRTQRQALGHYRQIVAMSPRGARLRLNLAAAFDCPSAGPTEVNAVLNLLEQVVAVTGDVEIALCDTTGRASLEQVRSLFTVVQDCFREVRCWAFRGHESRGSGAAKAMAAFDAGVRVFDGAITGVGGCPLATAEGDTVSTEDLVRVFDGIRVKPGIEPDALAAAVRKVSRLQAACVGKPAGVMPAAARALQRDCSMTRSALSTAQ
jgi:hydroxymethylglutaryl-CoA lyase